MLSMRTGPLGDGTVSRPICSRVAPLVLEHADLDRVLLLPFLVERDLVVAGHRQPQRVADGRHPHAEIGGAPAIDGDVNLRVRDAQAHLRLGEARQLLRRLERLHRVVGQLLRGRARGCSPRSAKPPWPSPLPSALRDGDARAVRRDTSASRCRISAIICSWVRLRSSSGSACTLKWMCVARRRRRRRPRRCRRVDDRLDLGDALDALQLLQHAERELLGALERRAFGRVHVDGPLAHVLVRHEVAADHPVQRERHQERRPPRCAMMTPGVIERPVHLPRVPAVEPVEEAALLGLVIGDARRTASGSAS